MSARDLADGERDLVRLTPRARAAVAPVASFLGIVLLAFYLAAQFDLAFQRWVIAIGAAVLIALVAVPGFIGWWSIRYRLTTHRLIARRGLVRVRRAELSFVREMTVSVTRSTAQRLARCGDVRIALGESPVFVLRDIPEPELVASVVVGAVATAPYSAPEAPRYD